jgi:hypothetical protein
LLSLSVKGHNSVKNRWTGKSSLYAHLPIIILLCAKFHPNPLRNVGWVAFTRKSCFVPNYIQISQEM